MREVLTLRAGAMGIWRAPRTWLILVSAVSFLFVACSEGGRAATDQGVAAPEFEIELFDTPNHVKGETLRLSDLKGHPVVLNFWYPSCPPCRLEMPDLEAAWLRYRDDGVRFVAVQVPGFDSVEDGQAFVEELGLTFAVGATSDSNLIIEYGVRSFPTTVFLNKNHEVVQTWGGVLNAEKLSELLKETNL